MQTKTDVPRDVMPREGALVTLDVPPQMVGLCGAVEPGDELRVVETRELEIVVRKAWEMGTTYRLGPGHVQPAD